MSPPIKTTVIGSGLAAQAFHVPLVLSDPSAFTLHSVVERSPPKDKPEGTIAHKFKVSVKLVNRYEDAIDDPEVELVIVGTPPSTHYEIAKRALGAGKHVLVDKPITSTYAEAKELEQLAEAKSVVLYAFQNRRWDADYLTLKKVLQEGTLGNIVDCEIHYDRYSTGIRTVWKGEPAPGAGLIYDLGPHALDQALDLFGRPRKVSGFLQNIRGIGHESVDDNFTLLLHYDKLEKTPYPLTVIVRASPLSRVTPQLKYLVRGDKGSFIKHGVDVQEDQVSAHGVAAFSLPEYGLDPHDGELETVKDGVPVKEKVKTIRGDYRGLYQNLHLAIRQGAEHTVKWHESANVILITELAKQSSQEGRTVDVPQA